jgi:WD40 repeat protein
MLFLWSPAQSRTPLLKIPQSGPVLALTWSPDGKKIAAAAGKTVALWALA